MNADTYIASTILSQLGGWRFVIMTGSKDFINLGNGLRFSVARNKTAINRCEIIYDEVMDLYNVRFYRQTMSKKTFEIKVKDYAKYEGIYYDQLEDIFSDVTGMCTRL